MALHSTPTIRMNEGQRSWFKTQLMKVQTYKNNNNNDNKKLRIPSMFHLSPLIYEKFKFYDAEEYDSI